MTLPSLSLLVRARTAGTNRPIAASTSSAAFEPAIFGAERLRAVLQPADEDAQAEDEQEVADDRAGQAALTTSIRPGLQREERDDQLGDVAERGVEDAADLRPGDRAEPLGGLSDQPGEPEDRDRGEPKRRVGVEPEVEHDRGDAGSRRRRR